MTAKLHSRKMWEAQCIPSGLYNIYHPRIDRLNTYGIFSTVDQCHNFGHAWVLSSWSEHNLTIFQFSWTHLNVMVTSKISCIFGSMKVVQLQTFLDGEKTLQVGLERALQQASDPPTTQLVSPEVLAPQVSPHEKWPKMYEHLVYCSSTLQMWGLGGAGFLQFYVTTTSGHGCAV